MPLKNEELRAYAGLLQRAGFAIYEPKGSVGYFAYSRMVDDQECFGMVQTEWTGLGSFQHLMPIMPSREHGSSMHVDGVPDELTVQVARKIASPTNTNSVVGAHANWQDRRWLSEGYEKWEVLPTPAFVVGDRVEYGSVGAPWKGTIVDVRGDYVDVQWDHDSPGDVDVAIDARTRTLRVVE